MVIVMGITSPEYWEYQRRKKEAQTEQGIGAFLLILPAFLVVLGTMDPTVIIPNIGLIWVFSWLVAITLLWDASAKLKRIEHITLTKQALREYEQSKGQNIKKVKIDVLEEDAGIFSYSKPIIQSLQETFFNFPKRRGKGLLFPRLRPANTGEAIICPECMENTPTDSKFCVHCGGNIISDKPIRTSYYDDLERLSLEKRQTIQMLDDIDKSLIQGNINELMYKEMKNKYDIKLKKLEQEHLKTIKDIETKQKSWREREQRKKIEVEETTKKVEVQGLEKERRINDYLDKFLAGKKQSGERFTSKEICNELRLAIPNLNLENITVINRLLDLVKEGKIEKSPKRGEVNYYVAS